MRKRYLIVLVAWTILCLLTYVAMGFIQWNWNMQSWTDTTRGLMVLIDTALAVFGMVLVHDNSIKF